MKGLNTVNTHKSMVYSKFLFYGHIGNNHVMVFSHNVHQLICYSY